MKNSKTTTVLILSFVFTIFVFSAAVYEYWSIKNVNVEALDLNTQLSSEQSSLASFNELSKTSSNIKADSEKANSFFIKRDEIVNFLDSIDSIASSTNTQISVVSVDERKTTANQSLLSVSLNIAGSYSNVYYAVRFLEELPYQTELKNVKLSVNGVTSSDKKVASVNLWSAKVDLVGVMK